MNLEEASTIANAIALRFGEFAISDAESAAEWASLAKISRATSDIAHANAARYAKRAETREREAKAILFLLLKLSETLGESNGRKCSEGNANPSTGGNEAAQRL